MVKTVATDHVGVKAKDLDSSLSSSDVIFHQEHTNTHNIQENFLLLFSQYPEQEHLITQNPNLSMQNLQFS
ncbi:hypothetical protein Hanom_Chr10g00940451 [Helianthus anomalus]